MRVRCIVAWSSFGQSLAKRQQVVLGAGIGSEPIVPGAGGSFVDCAACKEQTDSREDKGDDEKSPSRRMPV